MSFVFRLGTHVKDCVDVASLPTNLCDPQHRAVFAISSLDPCTLMRVSEKFSYRFDAVRTGRGGHILRLTNKQEMKLD